MDAKELFSGMKDDTLLEATQAALEIARERGLEIPFTAGVIAVEGSNQGAQAEPEAEPIPDTKESIAQQLTFAHKGYQSVIDALNTGRKKDVLAAATKETLANEFEAWFTNDKLAYVTAAREADPNVRFTLVATPNVVVAPADIIKLAKAFGENQPYEASVSEPLYSQYSALQLSGTDPDNGRSVQFSLIPGSYTPEMSGTVEQRRMKLAKLQVDYPDLKVPSVLEAVSYWQTLRAQGDRLADSTAFARTCIWHFDLPEQRLGDLFYTPYSGVGDPGWPVLSYSRHDVEDNGLVSVG